MTIAGSSKTSAVLVAIVGPNGYSWKTSQESLLPMPAKRSAKSSERWPKTGSLRSGHVYERPTLVPPTADFAGSALATPTAWLGRRPSQSIGDPDRWENKARSRELSDQMAHLVERLLPTPSANEPGYAGTLVDKNGSPVEHVAQRCYDPITGRLVQTGLPQAVKLFPTPTARDHKDTGPNVNHARGAAKSKLPGTMAMLPTPMASDGTKASGNPETSIRRIAKGQQPFLTDIVQAYLQADGGHTLTPSNAGNPSSDEQHPNPPTATEV